MQSIDSLAAILRSWSSNKIKIDKLLEFYMDNPDLSKVRTFWKENQYDKSLIYVLAFLKNNQDKLHLKYVPVATNREFVALVGKDALHSNHATIKTIGQLLDIQKKNMHLEGRVLLQNLIKGYYDSKKPVLCVNSTTTPKEQCGALIHEIHAWLLSGCTLSPTPLTAFFYEWRTSIFSVPLLRQMDKIFFYGL